MTSPYPLYPSEGWLFDEDRALRDLMKGIVVTDHEDNQRNVEAWFGHPDQELREQKYPYITVDLLQIQEGGDRVHRGSLHLADPPSWWGLRPLQGREIAYLLEMPTPVDLDYQISSWARNPRHDRQILTQLIAGGRTTLRGGHLFTADRKNRRLDFHGHMKRDTVESGKRLFNNVFRVRVSSEVPWGAIQGVSGGYAPPPPYGPYGTVVRVSLTHRLKAAGVSVEEGTIVGATVTSVSPDGTAIIVLVTDETPRAAIVPTGIFLMVGDQVAVSEDTAAGKYLILGVEARPGAPIVMAEQSNGVPQ